MIRLRFALPLLLIAGLVGVLALGLSLDPREVDSPLIDRPAPAFSLPVLDGEGVITQADLSRQVSLFNVWASWCVSCRQEHPVLVELSRRPDIRIYGLNYKDTPEAARAWLAQHGNPYRASGQDADGHVGIDYGVYGVPETFVVDTRGIVVAKRIGPLTWDYVNTELLPLLERLEKS